MPWTWTMQKKAANQEGSSKIGRLMQDGRGMTDRGGLGRKRRCRDMRSGEH